MSYLIKRPLLGIRLKTMMLGPSVFLRHFSRESPQLISACQWKSHNTFTQFYLKDVAWADSEFFHFGPSSGCSADPPLTHIQISSLSPYPRVFKVAVACSRLPTSHLLKRASPRTELIPLFPYLRGGLLRKRGARLVQPSNLFTGNRSSGQLMPLEDY